MRTPDPTAAVLLCLLEERGVGPATAIARVKDGLTEGAINGSALSRIENDLAALEEQGVRAVGFFDDDFPKRLRIILSPPAVLFVRGELPPDAVPALAVIGTREPTNFGRSAAETLTAAAAGEGMVIVSGLALGVDAIAHEQALRSGVRTVAILGSGLGNVSPRQNRGLAERIVSAGGALVSEQPHLASPSPHSLVSRNRLQTGLSDALLVCQTGLKGGSLHTVRFAAEQGKPVWVAEPRGPSEASEGNIAIMGRAARDLPELMPAWRGKARLAERFGEQPIGRGVSSDAVAAWLRMLREEPGPSGERDEAKLF